MDSKTRSEFRTPRGGVLGTPYRTGKKPETRSEPGLTRLLETSNSDCEWILARGPTGRILRSCWGCEALSSASSSFLISLSDAQPAPLTSATMPSHDCSPVLDEAVFHPLDPITTKEVQTLKEVVGKAGYGGPICRYSYVMLREPDHATMKAFKSGDAIPREIGALLLNLDDNAILEVVVDIPAGKIIYERVLDPAVEGWSPIMDEDYTAAENILKAYPDYLDALKKRGVDDISQVRCLPLSAGVYGYEDEVGCRMIPVLSFLASENTHSMFAHPIDGIVAHVDPTNCRVARLIDTGYNHIPMESGDYLDPKVTGPMRTSMKPLHITQPEGASFSIKNHVLDWEKWEIRVGFNGREGLTLHDISFNDKGQKRPILNRASVSEMVVPYVVNYEYGFYWYFYLDGRIELECKATGLVFTSGRAESKDSYVTEMAPRLGAPCHQHLFSARLDVAIDGNKCHVDELEVEQLPISPDNPVGNAFRRMATRLTRESDAQRLADNYKGRMWRISSSDTTNRLGNPTAYTLIPEGQPLLLAASESSVAKRAIFASKHLWVTQYARDEMWAAGYTPNQNPGFAGLPAYTKSNRSVDGEDIVLWHTFGLTHFPRPEDGPIMPVDYAKFTLRPEGFFDRNPTLDVPEDPNGKEHSQRCCP
ncbi:unnamed protein product [Phytophthora fragariaefolia]|uniref:Amine oxidase n=1 Tax=Phytophthora fragariaefolia TaxID=1490495 RepID=A0A9W7D0F3_9STRA|nr:unnamed protein product [Phytophthora fragariaefolia]